MTEHPEHGLFVFWSTDSPGANHFVGISFSFGIPINWNVLRSAISTHRTGTGFILELMTCFTVRMLDITAATFDTNRFFWFLRMPDSNPFV